jgi:hypothetical protein
MPKTDLGAIPHDESSVTIG